jgi:hypothetical protein
MTKSAWLEKAKKLHKTASDQQKSKNGSTKCTTSEAKTENELQKAIGSNHAIKQVTYNELRESLDTMFDLVKGGHKDDLFS